MSWRASRAREAAASPAHLRRAGVLALAVALVVLASLVPAAAQRPSGAGLVIRHGDGTLIYVYVQFEGESISGEELFYRSGLEVTLAPFGGLGAGVCAINGEGCPSDDCWCQSYTAPAYYWHYYALVDGAWLEQIRGPTTRSLADGDVDGWSWTAGESGLPATSIDEIALLNGIDRNAPEPPATATATATETATEPPTEPSPTPTPTNAPTEPESATFTPTPESTTPTLAVPTQSQSAQAGVASTATDAVATPTIERATVQATVRPPSTVMPPPTERPTTVAVAIDPSGTKTIVETSGASDSSATMNYAIFGAMATVVVVVGVLAFARGRWGRA